MTESELFISEKDLERLRQELHDQDINSRDLEIIRLGAAYGRSTEANSNNFLPGTTPMEITNVSDYSRNVTPLWDDPVKTRPGFRQPKTSKHRNQQRK